MKNQYLIPKIKKKKINSSVKKFLFKNNNKKL